MTAIGGPIIEFTIAGRYFSVAEDAESNRQLGGFNNEVTMNGDGTARLEKTRVPWAADGLSVAINEDIDDQQFLQSVADRFGFEDMTIGYASGAIFQGRGQIVGEIAMSSKTATAPIGLKGTGTFTRQ